MGDTVALGAAFQRQARNNGADLGVLQAIMDTLKADILAELRGNIADETLAKVIATLNQRAALPSPVTVTPAQVTVTPQITVNVPETDQETISVEIPGMTDMAASLTRIETLLKTYIAAATQPVTRQVHRGRGGLIESITEQR